MLFVRDFTSFSGGHLKFADYMKHTAASGLARPVLYQTSRSRLVQDNIFSDHDGPIIDELRPFPTYFVAGLDWFILDGAGIESKLAPVVNLIQGLRHAEPANPLFACLKRPALRICVSHAVADAIRDHANGDVHVLENCIDVGPIPDCRPIDGSARILVAGFKNPTIAREVAARLDGLVEVDLVTELLPRPAFLARMARSSVCILLPLEREGFFPPALEAMALGRCVITADCGGNRGYCQPGENCLMPAYAAETFATAALALINDGAKMKRLAAGGLKTAAECSIEKERSAYHAILARYLGRSS